MLGSHLFSDLASHVAINSIFHLQTHEKDRRYFNRKKLRRHSSANRLLVSVGGGQACDGSPHFRCSTPKVAAASRDGPPRESGTRGHTYFLPAAFHGIVDLLTFSST